MSVFRTYSVGIVCMSVCTDLPDAEVEERANLLHPTGIDSRWKISPDPFADGTPNPHVCLLAPSQRHVLLVC